MRAIHIRVRLPARSSQASQTLPSARQDDRESGRPACATSQRSPFLRGLEDAVAANLDYIITTQQEDGSWQPTWSWAEAWPEVWEQARQEWAGVLTLETLLTLERFSRIEEVDRC